MYTCTHIQKAYAYIHTYVECLSLKVVSSIPAGSTIIHRFLCGFICVSLCQSIKIKPTNMYVASARAQFKINTHRCWNWHLCIPDGLSVVQCSHGHVIGVAFFWRDFSGVKRTCWTSGSWRSCLSMKVVSSIPAGSTIIHRFLCGFICVSLCQSIKIKPTNIYVNWNCSWWDWLVLYLRMNYFRSSSTYIWKIRPCLFFTRILQFVIHVFWISPSFLTCRALEARVVLRLVRSSPINNWAVVPSCRV